MRRGDQGEQSGNYSNVSEPPQISLIQKVFNEEHSSENTQNACLLGVLTAGSCKETGCWTDRSPPTQTFKLLSSVLVDRGNEVQGISKSFFSLCKPP